MEERSLFDQQVLTQMVELIEQQFGTRCEVVLHDLSKPYGHTIIDIRNGHLTGRSIGDSGSNLGLEVIRGTVKEGDRFNLVTHMRDGKIMRSSSIYLRDTQGKLYSLCVNSDITESLRFESYLHEANRYDLADKENEEVFVNNVSELLEYFLLKGQEAIGREASAMNKKEKMQLLEFLDKKGAFLITRSGKRVCEALNISKFTLYNYLETIRKLSGTEKNTATMDIDLDFNE